MMMATAKQWLPALVWPSKVHSLEEELRFGMEMTLVDSLVIVTNPCEAYLHTLVKSATNLAISDKDDQLAQLHSYYCKNI